MMLIVHQYIRCYDIGALLFSPFLNFILIYDVLHQKNTEMVQDKLQCDHEFLEIGVNIIR